jgi:hypothetical protein
MLAIISGERSAELDEKPTKSNVCGWQNHPPGGFST